MNNDSLKINPSTETQKITSFIKTVLKREGFKNVVVGMSAGLDSTTAFYLLKKAVPPQNIIIAHLYYLDSQFKDIEGVLKQARIPKNNIYEMSISPLVGSFQKSLHLGGVMASHSLSLPPSEVQKRIHLRGGILSDTSEVTQRGSSEVKLEEVNPVNRVRLGNIMARVRMIILYDLAKKHNALVAGTENRSEFLLGYFTRFGDQASDFEPIQHLYKTQVYELAKFLGVPENIIIKTPTAGLWPGQTDEGEFGFSYKEADQVLFYYYDKKLKLEEIKNKGYKNAKKIIDFATKNSYKHNAPYVLNKNV